MTHRQYYFLFFIVGFASLSFEVCLTRFFSFLLYKDFVFLAISAAVLGISLGAALSPLMPRPGNGRLPFGLAGGLGLLCPAALLLTLLAPSEDPYFIWILFSLLSLPPFIIHGLLAAHFYAALPEKSGRLYAADLSGAALGALAAVPAMALLGPVGYTLFFSLALLFCLIIPAIKDNQRSRFILPALGMAAFAVFAFLLSGNRLERTLLDRTIPGKPMFDDAKKPFFRVLSTAWNAAGRFDLTTSEHEDLRYVFSDGGVPAAMHRFDGTPASAAHLRKSVTFAPFTYGGSGRVLSIGSGAGKDCLLGLLAGVREMTAVEISRSLVDLVRGDSAFNGKALDLPFVRLAVDEGRCFARASREQYDLILLYLAQGNNVEAAGRVMSDNYLLTEEAFTEYYDRLSPGGRIAVITHNPHRASRHLMTWAAMLEKKGVPLPQAVRRFAFLSSPDVAYRLLLIFHRDLPDTASMLRLKAFADTTDAEAIYLPYVLEEDKDLGGMARGVVSAETFIRTSPKGIPIGAVSDNRPFQNDVYAGVHPALKGLIRLSLYLLAGLALVSLFFLKRAKAPLPAISWIAYFVLLGMGFMIAEVVLMHRLMLYLGYPVLAISAVLFALLISAGGGGFISQRAGIRTVALIAGILGVLLIFLLPLMDAVMGKAAVWPLASRLIPAMLFIALPGFLMGIPFPAGMARIGGLFGRSVSWMWAINGLASTAGSLLAMAVCVTWGIKEAFWAAGACYLVAGLIFSRFSLQRSA